MLHNNATREGVIELIVISGKNSVEESRSSCTHVRSFDTLLSDHIIPVQVLEQGRLGRPCASDGQGIRPPTEHQHARVEVHFRVTRSRRCLDEACSRQGTQWTCDTDRPHAKVHHEWCSVICVYRLPTHFTAHRYAIFFLSCSSFILPSFSSQFSSFRRCVFLLRVMTMHLISSFRSFSLQQSFFANPFIHFLPMLPQILISFVFCCSL